MRATGSPALAGALCGLVFLISVQVSAGPVFAQGASAPAAPPPQVDELLRLMEEPAVRMKMMTRPGEQFVIRRKGYAMLKKAFDENGIKFAFPTVQVAGRDDAEPAAARQVLTLIKGKPPEEGG